MSALFQHVTHRQPSLAAAHDKCLNVLLGHPFRNSQQDANLLQEPQQR
jgi:hypothetical protein